jgi:hypothetical protein
MTFTRLHTTLGAFNAMVLAIRKAANNTRLLALALACFTERSRLSTTHSTIIQMIAHARVALNRSTAGTFTVWGAKSFLMATLTTIHVATDSTAESRSSCSIRIEVDEIAALRTLPLLIDHGFLESRVCLGHIHNTLPIAGLLSDQSNNFSGEIRQLELLRHGGVFGHDSYTFFLCYGRRCKLFVFFVSFS